MSKETLIAAESEKNIQKKIDESKVNQTIRQFIEHKLSGKNGWSEFDAIIWAKWNGLGEEFLKFLEKNGLLDGFSSEQKESFKNVEGIRFLYETLKIGVGFESKRASLLGILEKKYQFPDKKAMKKIEKEIDGLSLSDLAFYQSARWLENFAKEKKLAEKIAKKNLLAFIDELKLDPNVLSSKQKDALQELNRSSFPIPLGWAQKILPLFSEQQQKDILSVILPMISLDILVQSGIYSKEKAESIFQPIARKILARRGMKKNEIENFMKSENIVDLVDFSDIIIETEEVFVNDKNLEALLKSNVFLESFRGTLNEAYDILTKDMLEKIPREVLPNEKGELTPDFLRILTEKMKHINNVALLGDEEHRKGNKPLYLIGDCEIDKKIERICIRIDWWNEYTNWSKQPTINCAILNLHNGWVIPGNKSTIGYTYKEFFNLLKTFTKGDIVEEKIFNNKIATSEIIARPVGNIETGSLEIQNLQELNNELNTIDKEGKKYPIVKGSAFVATFENKSIQAFTIKDIINNEIFLSSWSGKEEGGFSFGAFFARFWELSAHRIHNLGTMESCLSAIKEHTSKKKDFTDLEYDSTKKKIIPKDRKGEKDFPWVTLFYGKDRTLIEVTGMEEGSIKIKFHEKIIEKKDEKGNRTIKPESSSGEQTMGYEMFYSLLENYQCIPGIDSKPVEAVETKKSDMHMHRGFFSSWMQGLSFHDILSGGKSLVKFIEHKLEHSSKLHSAKASLALAKMIGMNSWNEEWLWELESQIQNDNKKLMDEELGKMGWINPPGKRHKYILATLQNKWAPDYHLQAAAICMLQKHGTLYAGDTLKEYEGSWLFYKRLRGIPVDADVNKDGVFKEICASLTKEKKPIREELVLIEYFQKHAAKYSPETNPNIWKMIKDGWKDGMTAEMEGGKNEAGSFMALEPKMEFVMKKWKSKEYASGLGALEKIWWQGGTQKQMQEASFVLAMSNVPDKLREENLKGSTLAHFFSGHTYPGLVFSRNPGAQKLFRKIVTTLSEESGNMEMKSANAKIQSQFATNPDSPDLIDSLLKFWAQYGDELGRKLSVSPKDPEIFLKKDLPGYEHYKEYFGTLEDFIGDSSFHTDKTEEENGTYGLEKTSFILINPDKYLDDMGFQGGPGALQNQKSAKIFEEYIHTIDLLKERNKSEEEKINLYRRYHKSFLTKVIEGLGPDTYKRVASGESEPDYAIEMRKRGITLPKAQDKSLLEGDEYEKHVLEDFEAFKRGGHSISTKERTILSFEEIMKKKTGLDSDEKEEIREQIRKAA